MTRTNPPPNPSTLQVDCAWCGAEIHAGDKRPGAHISHGICSDCEPKINPDVGVCPVCKREGFTATGLVGCVCGFCERATYQPLSEALAL